MSILIPALNRAKKQARTVICLNNLHQWGIVWKLFTDEHGGYFDLGKDWDWVEPLYDYYKNEALLLCPEAKKTALEGGTSPFVAWEFNYEEMGRTFRGSYGLNCWVTKDESASSSDAFNGTLRWKTTSAQGAQYAPLMTDCLLDASLPHHCDEPPSYDGEAWPGDQGNDKEEIRRFCMNRHDGYVCGVFIDGHIRKICLKELWELRWDKNWFRVGAYDATPDFNPPVWPDWMKVLPCGSR